MSHPLSSTIIPTAPAVELRHLRYFLAVAEELHFGRAARRLHIAQPALSQAIRKLEGELGVVLLHRTSRVVTLSEAGRVFAGDARRVLAGVNLAVTEARRTGGASSEVRLGCVPNLPMRRLLRFVTALRERDPSLSPRVVHLPALEQLDRLRDGDLELGIVHAAEEHPELRVEPLFPGEKLAVYLSAGHRLAAREAIGPEQLRDEQLVTVPRDADPALHDRLLALFEEKGYRFENVREAAGPTARDVLVATAVGGGIGILPCSLEEAGEPGGATVRCRLDPFVSLPDTVLASRRSLPPALRAAVAAARATARELFPS